MWHDLLDSLNLLSKDRDQQSLLNRLRDSLQPLVGRFGSSFAATGLSANFWTAVGLVLSVAASATYASVSLGFHWYYAAVLGGVILLASGFFDMIDGSVARITGKASKKGAFLDSAFDKIAECVIFLGIAGGGLAHPVWTMLALATSLLVSYTRSRAESLGVELKGVGIAERAERILIIAFVGMIPHREALTWAMIVVSVVAGLTLAQRIWVSSAKLRTT